MAHYEPDSILTPGRSGRPSLLQMLVQPGQAHRHDGPSQPGRELPSLVRFLPRSSANVAVGQPRSSQPGDVRNEKTQHLGESPTEGQGLFSGFGLTSQQHDGEEMLEVPSPSTPQDSHEFDEDTSRKNNHKSPSRSRSPAKPKKQHPGGGHQSAIPFQSAPMVESTVGVSGTKVCC